MHSFLRGNSTAFPTTPSASSSHGSNGLSERWLTTEDSPENTATWLIQAIVAIISLFFVVSMYQFILGRCRGRRNFSSEELAGDITEDKTQVFQLSEEQRRAVLEAIYAEQCKPAKELGVAAPSRTLKTAGSEKGLTAKTIDHDIPFVLKLPRLILQASFEAPVGKTDGFDLDITCIDLSLSTDSTDHPNPSHDEEVNQSNQTRHHVTQHEQSTPSTVDTTDEHHPLGDQTANRPQVHRMEHESEESSSRLASESTTSFQANLKSCERAGMPRPDSATSLPSPFLECCLPSANISTADDDSCHSHQDAIDQMEEGMDQIVDTCRNQTHLVTDSPNSFAAQASEYAYEEDGASLATCDDVCPICLSGYVTNDVLIKSKHCTHVFHKDCIMEWLQKNDDCPICRTSMITESEVNQAASSIVGKARMYRAVASMSRPSNRRPSVVESSHRRTGSSQQRWQANVTPLSGTVLQSVSISFA